MESEYEQCGCRFPGRCVMPGDHIPEECHTAEMAAAGEPLGDNVGHHVWQTENDIFFRIGTRLRHATFKLNPDLVDDGTPIQQQLNENVEALDEWLGRLEENDRDLPWRPWRAFLDKEQCELIEDAAAQQGKYTDAWIREIMAAAVAKFYEQAEPQGQGITTKSHTQQPQPAQRSTWPMRPEP